MPYLVGISLSKLKVLTRNEASKAQVFSSAIRSLGRSISAFTTITLGLSQITRKKEKDDEVAA
jgi:hypothetical protein